MFFRIHAFQDPGFFGSRFFRVQVFHGPGFSGSRFFRIQVFEGPGFSGSGSKVPVQVLEVAAVKYFTNHSILDVLQGSKYGSGYSSLLKQSL